MSRFQVKKVAVLGAGVMGAQIAAHLVNCRVPVVLFDLPAKEGEKNGIVTRAIDNLRKLKPAPIAEAGDLALIEAANYEDDLARLGECDLLIEAIAERLEWKHDLYRKIAPHVASHAILASNTSGLPIAKLAEPLPDALKQRFCGIHFFNPPRYMMLVELIATAATEPKVLDELEAFVTTGLGKGVVRANDTPNFVANRVGIAGLLGTMKEAERLGLTFDQVDSLTGKELGRASSGTFRTADIVGLDTLAHVIKTLQDNLSEASDSFYGSFGTPAALAALLEMKNLGQKTGAGFFKKVGRDILRFDAQTRDYVPVGEKADPVYLRMLKRAPLERLKLLRGAEGKEGQFLWAILRNGFHYAAVHLKTIAPTARDVDLAMRWGFGMKQGPFELWQEAGWLAVANMIQEDIDAGKALSREPLPSWVFEGPVAERGGVHQSEGSWSAAESRFVPRRVLPVYERQLFPERVRGEAAPDPRTAGETVYEDDALRAWTLDGEVLIASFKSKQNTIGPQMVEALNEAMNLAEERFRAVVVWQFGEPFSFGADLEAMLPGFLAGGKDLLDAMEKELQDLMLRIRYSPIPVVAAMRGMALGGGCELAVHCARRVLAMESYIGLVEVGVGLVPGAGGLTYVARRAAENAQSSTGKDLLPFLTEGFTAAAMAKVGTSALESRKLGYVLWSDVVVPHKDEVLYVAIEEARALARRGYRPPMKRLFPVAGRDGKATIQGQLVNLRDGGMASAHDFYIASLIAGVVTGGDVDPGTMVNEEYLMTLERRAFGQLLGHAKTQERIMGILNTGQPLRN